MSNQLHGFADLHVHTHASNGRYTTRELLQYVSRHTPLDVIAITDYDRVDAALWACEHQDEYAIDIVPGTEVHSADGHGLGLWVTEPVPQNMSLDETVTAIHEQGGLAVLAHPFHFHLGVVAGTSGATCVARNCSWKPGLTPSKCIIAGPSYRAKIHSPVAWAISWISR